MAAPALLVSNDDLGGTCVWPKCGREGAVVRIQQTREAVTTLCRSHRKDFWGVSS